ncbi:ABC transporter ATP-binding protein [Anaerococcus sp. AGMB00486]|uniref:Putative hemin import ATP-binding protein HrtA n=2 Tax=Anaerococcus TaxID=165779 RepID=A0ABX2NCY0_9FIRM|nr:MULTISPECIES: ABC transporter ATP-binding protein [Anaerococcus]MSS77855.1 ABC transporter ATP-binding protein [Anaerococcus porci]NVF12510.1 ABC transporter ATP-binding protein [Anaerococcus faecalis]
MEIIKFDNVKKYFKDGDEKIEALKDTSFSINKGELVAVIGPSGSGKSTMLTMMGGLQKPSEGSISFKDENISKKSEKDLANLRFDKIGFILQSSNLVSYLTIMDQFKLVDKFGKNKFDEKRAENLLKKLDVYKRKDKYPTDLSGGERQRVAIARALYPSPDLILADEPTASLDTKRAIDVVKILKNLSREEDVSIVMVTHDIRLVDYCDRVFKIVDGNLKEEI